MDLARVKKMLTLTIGQWVSHRHTANYKQRKTTHKHWNQYNLVQLKQLRAICDRLLEAGGGFVLMRDLLRCAREVDDCEANVTYDHRDGGSAHFPKWVFHCLSPACVIFKFEKGAANHADCRNYAYAAPTTGEMTNTMLRSFRALQRQLNEVSVKATLQTVDVGSYLSLLTERSTKRVLRALVGDILDSKTFLKSNYGWDAHATESAQEKVTAALAMTAAFAERDELTVPTNRTEEEASKAAKARKKEIQDIIAGQLADQHAGGTESLLEKCSRLGLDLKELMETAAAKLGSFSYEDDEGGAAAVGRRRDSADAERGANCSWKNIGKEVQAAVQAKEKALPTPPQKLTTVDGETCRRYTAARISRSLVNKQHTALAEISHKKLTSKSEEFNIDAHAGNAFVRNMEQSWAEHAEEAVYRLWDDHAKWEPDKRRGYTSRRTLMLNSKVKTAPYSDMGSVMGGVKAVTNSMLLLLPRQFGTRFWAARSGGTSQPARLS